MRPLDGIRVLELARVPPAELPGLMLADMGADVLKFETPEPSGRAIPTPTGGPPSPSSIATSAR
jgi:crotonobetainyl-CoA:carnitine CoA-transferase CaiB-like acyl-CoA transferase